MVWWDVVVVGWRCWHTWEVTVEGAVPGKPTSLEPPGPVGWPEYCTVPWGEEMREGMRGRKDF